VDSHFEWGGVKGKFENSKALETEQVFFYRTRSLVSVELGTQVKRQSRAPQDKRPTFERSTLEEFTTISE